MAGVFGDSSLFDEFDKERPSVATFISYKQNERGEDDTSKIVFQCQNTDSDSSSDWEQEAKDDQARTSETNSGKDEDQKEEMDESDNEDDKNFSKKASKKDTNGEVRLGALKYTNHQLQFERILSF